MTKQEAKEYGAAYYRKFTQWCFSILSYSCAECGATANLEMDHIDATTKSFTITSRMAPKYREAVKKELKKCQTLCEGCHARKTAREQSAQRKKDRSKCHGTLSQYWRYRCRCELCRDAHRAYKHKREGRGEHSQRRPYRKATHGTDSMYRNGCHCDLCKEAHRLKAKEFRKKARGQDGNATAC